VQTTKSVNCSHSCRLARCPNVGVVASRAARLLGMLVSTRPRVLADLRSRARKLAPTALGFSFLICVGIATGGRVCLANGRASPPPAFKTLNDRAGASLEAALGLTPSSVRFAPAYEAALKAYESRSKNRVECVRKLVSRIARGANPLGIYRLRVALSRVPFHGAYLQSPFWHYGTAGEENQLGDYILHVAERMRARHPAIAARYARAALICLHVSYFDNNDFAIAMAVDNRRVDLARLAALSPRERKMLEAYVRNPALNPRGSQHLELQMALTQYHLASGHRVTNGAVATLIAESAHALGLGQASPRYQADIISLDWQVMCIAKLRDAPAEAARLTQYLQETAKSDRRPWVRRWAAQALRAKVVMPTPDMVFAVPSKLRIQLPGAKLNGR
jgi:hypothetical protein